MTVASRTFDRARALRDWFVLSIVVVVAVTTLWPVGMTGWRLAIFVAGALIGAVAAIRRDRIGRWLRHFSEVCMGGTLINVVFHNPFDWHRWCGLVVLTALLVLAVSQASTESAPERSIGR